MFFRHVLPVALFYSYPLVSFISFHRFSFNSTFFRLLFLFFPLTRLLFLFTLFILPSPCSFPSPFLLLCFSFYHPCFFLTFVLIFVFLYRVFLLYITHL
jgi:hypothetical protein